MGFSLSGKSVLVTGAAGCIGAWVIKGLVEVGAEPVVLDISDNRRRLDLIMQNTRGLNWNIGDITDFETVQNVIKNNQVEAIIHLAALQVPFAKADPVLGTRVNVMGTTHLFEAARHEGIERIVYASSIAAPAMGDNDHLATLYGAHKVCNEQMAAVYWQDWQVPSVCIRPGVIYGPGRDQGMSASPTLALLAAFDDKPYDIPFAGPVSYVHAEDAALRFIGAIARDTQGAPVFDMNGVVADMKDVIAEINTLVPNNDVSMTGSALPFPAEPDDGKLDAYIGASPHRSFKAGLSDTLTSFRWARENGRLPSDMINRLIGISS